STQSSWRISSSLTTCRSLASLLIDYLHGRAALPNNASRGVMTPCGCAFVRFMLMLKPLSSVHKAGAVVACEHHYPPATHPYLHAIKIGLFGYRLLICPFCFSHCSCSV